MTAITESLKQRFQVSAGGGFNWQYFLLDNITGSWLLTVWVIALTLVTAVYTAGQMNATPISTTIILALWAIGILLAVLDGLHLRHTAVGNWLKNNLLSSVSNTLLTLFLLLVIYALVNSIWQWAYVNATFDPALTAPPDRSPDGATWGVIIGAWDLLMVGRFPRDQMGRVTMALIFFVLLGGVSVVANKIGLWDRIKPLRSILTGLWLLSPIVVYMLLAGVPAPEESLISISTLITGEILVLATFGLFWWQRVIKFSWLNFIAWALAWPVLYIAWQAIGKSEAFPPISLDLWGGLMLTFIIAASVIMLSFPLGLVLALGRRSEVRGIPWWLIWPVAIVVAIWGFSNSTPDILARAESTWQLILAFWPLLIIAAAYILQRMFQGNVIAAASTTFIEFVRGVPLITLLFMAIIMAPFFLPEGANLEKVLSVIIGYALFSAAYMAELIRGGLQAIPRGQFDAADAIGLNTLQKMRFIVLPQALRIVIPGIVGQFIGSFKSSSLVAIVGLFELVGIIKVIVSNPQWIGLRLELFVFAGLIYFTGSFIMSWYSRRLESRLRVGLQ
jgi:general L-amino acid transport system permease protein